jgi:hypothetical protein
VSQRRGGQIGAGQLRPAGDRWAKLMPAGALPGSACEVGRDDVRGVPVQAAAAPVIPHRGPGVRMGGCLLDIAERHPGLQGCGDERVPKRVGCDGLADPGAAGGLRTIRPAACRSSRRSSLATNTGPSARSPMARSIARAVRGASGTVTTLPLAAPVLRRPAGRRARCGPARRHGTRSRSAAGGHGQPGSGPGVLLGPRTCRTRRWWTAAG